MKSLLLSLAATASLAITPLNLHADTINLSLTTGSTVDALNSSPVTYDGVNAIEYTYLNQTVCAIGLGGCNSVLGSSTSLFTVIYAQVTPILTVLNVNDTCTQVVVIGSAPNCQSFTFSATNVKLGDGDLGVLSGDVLALANVSVGLGSAGLTFNGNTDTAELVGLGVHGGTDTFNYGPAPTPEPSSLCLMATGLATAAGVLRRRIKATA